MLFSQGITSDLVRVEMSLNKPIFDFGLNYLHKKILKQPLKNQIQPLNEISVKTMENNKTKKNKI